MRRDWRTALGDITNNAAQLNATQLQSIIPKPIVSGIEKPQAVKPRIELTDTDAESNDPQVVREYLTDIFEHIRAVEGKRIASPNYMKRQTDINAKMRVILVDWLVEVHRKFQLTPEVLYLSVNLIDRFLERKLVGCTAMFIASKYDMIIPPQVNDFVCITADAYSRKQVLQMECVMLNTLQFSVTVVTPYMLSLRYLRLLHSTEHINQTCFFLLELSLIEYSMLKYVPSLLAASAVFLARKVDGLNDWPELAVRQTKYVTKDLLPCATELLSIALNPNPREKAVRNKYLTPKRMRVAKLNFSNVHLP